MFFSFFKHGKKCLHKKMVPLSAGSFCPDCGKKIEISWLILRCKCCKSRRKAKVIFNSVVPDDKYCIKCGEEVCFLERRETLDFFEFDFAIISRKEVDSGINSEELLQVWVEGEFSFSGNIKLIPLLIK